MKLIFDFTPYDIEMVLDVLERRAEAWAKKQEVEDDDAEDESSNSRVATPEEVAEFVRGCTLDELEKYKAICEGIEELQKSLRAVGLRFSGSMRFDYADRSDDRS